MRRRILAASLVTGIAAFRGSAVAARIRRVGLFDYRPRENKEGMAQGFISEMTKLGFVEGKDIEYLHRHSDLPAGATAEARNARNAAIAEDLVRANPDAIVVSSTTRTRAVARATKTIPIVTSVGDPVRAGFAKSTARPGGNITGVGLAMSETYEKTFDIMKAIIPGNWSLATGFAEGATESEQTFSTVVADGARKVGLTVRTVNLKGMDNAQADRVFASLKGEGVRVLDLYGKVPGIPGNDFTLFATRYGLVSLPSHINEVEKGALMMLLPMETDIEQRMALQLARILRGTPPGDIPFDTSTRFGMAFNRKTARILGLTIPPDILLRADAVVD